MQSNTHSPRLVKCCFVEIAIAGYQTVLWDSVLDKTILWDSVLDQSRIPGKFFCFASSNVFFHFPLGCGFFIFLSELLLALNSNCFRRLFQLLVGFDFQHGEALYPSVSMAVRA
eukprot:Gregarina_sp_Poly_1__3582@NODE_204_length_11513_cov_91_076009_g182_i0_p10_GENE_NODE_204_length_11513_cov_91_076009_g182_i0NODE_204_length_11513_cov_91_076009_g182_i0_p10_ORF_typecomplete_len114_score12_02_NODE_204_length_11513_cov_91_076009_g182_i01037010711